MKEYKRLKVQKETSEKIIKKMEENQLELMSEMKGTKRELMENVKERDSLRLTVINLSPNVVVYQSILNPIQVLDSVDWSENRFRDILSIPYPRPHFGLCVKGTGNFNVYKEKVKRIQSILPVSVKDANM